jgi:NADH-quinone oxidoreductase subunit F
VTRSAPSKAVQRIVADVVSRLGSRAGGLVAILQELQESAGFLEAEVLEELARVGPFAWADILATATFFDGFRWEPPAGREIRVCHGTACHAAGSPRVQGALDHACRNESSVSLERAGCLGCCTLAPVVGVDGRVVGPVRAEDVAPLLEAAPIASAVTDSGTAVAAPGRGLEVRVGVGSCCVAKGADKVLAEVESWATRHRATIVGRGVGCVGICSHTPLLEIRRDGGAWERYAQVTAEEVPDLLAGHTKRGPVARLSRAVRGRLAELHGAPLVAPADELSMVDAAAFFAPQVRIATEGLGELDPTSLTDYQAHGGFQMLAVARREPDVVLETISRSGLRGRGGAGYPTADKWQRARSQPGPRIIVANGDEGDPGAFMDRMLMESCPFRVVEGMAIAAAVVGADRGVLHVRHEYPLALARCADAVNECRVAGILGPEFDVEVLGGAGAFVCGEESALLALLAGVRPEPALRPPYPAEVGYQGRPTVVNNVETLANLPWLVRHGAEEFGRHGTAESPGTKVFALAGKVSRGGLIEVPLGTTLEQIVVGIGGGAAAGRAVKAVQVGGPSGGCIPASALDLPLTYESLGEYGAQMGSGGLVVLDDRDCMVDLARFFVAFSAGQSCGRCSVGRIGTQVLLDGMNQLCAGRGKAALLERLEAVSQQLEEGALCGLCRAAPRPFVSSLKAFRGEYEAHLEGHCPAGRCDQLVHYRIKDNCTGCTLCAQSCPTSAIAANPLELHEIEESACIRCGVCARVCPFDAVEVSHGD